MNQEEFIKSLNGDVLPAGLSAPLQSMWYDGKGDWARAHEIVNDLSDSTSAWVHAYLHRKEGDPGNAGYWYRRAGKNTPATSLEKEWQDIVQSLLEK